MGRFSLSTGSARAVRMASALALALTLSAVLGSAMASAASPTRAEVNCDPAEPTTGSTMSCEAVISSSEGAPTGDVRFEKIGFMDLGAARCTLAPISASESRCALEVRLKGPGLMGIAGFFDGNATHEASADLFEVLVRPGGSIRIECSPEFGFPFEESTCEAFVPNTPGVSEAPSGSVHFLAEPEVGNGTGGEIDPECSLEAVPGGARCAVTFFPLVPINFPNTAVAILAEYEGDASHPAQFGSLRYLVLFQKETAVSASCDPAPFAGRTTCTMTVVNKNGVGGPPTGFVALEQLINSEEFRSVDSCLLRAREEEGHKALESSCQVIFEPRELGTLVLRASYRGEENFEASFSSPFEIEVIEPRRTALGLTCTANIGSFPGVCVATVIDTSANPIAPSGTVRLDVPAGVKLNRETCNLLPGSKAGTSSCAFGYTMDSVGVAAVVARYSGDFPKGHEPSIREGVVSRRS